MQLCVTVFSTGGKFYPVSIFTYVHILNLATRALLNHAGSIFTHRLDSRKSVPALMQHPLKTNVRVCHGIMNPHVVL